MVKPRLSEVVSLPFRRPLLLAVAAFLSVILYLAGLLAGIDEVSDPHWVLMMAIFLLATPLVNGAYILLVQTYRGGPRPSPAHVLSRVLAVYPRLIAGAILVNVAVLLGAILFVVPGVYAGLRLAFYKQAVLLDGAPLPLAMRESLRQTPRGRDAFLLLLYLAPPYAPLVLAYVAALAFPLGIAGEILMLVTSWLTFLWTNVLLTILYVPAPPRTETT